MFHDRTQATRTRLTLDRPASNGAQRVVGKGQFGFFQIEQPLILLDQSVFRTGQNFDQRGADVEAKSWYFFAGADGEALVYEPYGDRGWTNSMALRDQVTVGDMQAGLSLTQGGGQLSVSYIRREISYNERGMQGREDVENFAGISFTLRR